MTHPSWKNKRAFNGKFENGTTTKILIGEEVLKQLKSLGNITFGKGQKRKCDNVDVFTIRARKVLFFPITLLEKPYIKTQSWCHAHKKKCLK